MTFTRDHITFYLCYAYWKFSLGYHACFFLKHYPNRATRTMIECFLWRWLNITDNEAQLSSWMHRYIRVHTHEVYFWKERWKRKPQTLRKIKAITFFGVVVDMMRLEFANEVSLCMQPSMISVPILTSWLFGFSPWNCKSCTSISSCMMMSCSNNHQLMIQVFYTARSGYFMLKYAAGLPMFDHLLGYSTNGLVSPTPLSHPQKHARPESWSGRD